jgi:hypothetical protein
MAMSNLRSLLAENIRDITGDGAADEELRASLTQFGWVSELPALMDEHDVVLVGQRRLKIAAELKIDPVVKTLRLGDGDAADAERLKLAIASNIGFKTMTKNDRKRIAEHLYSERQWTLERIAEALNVNQSTITRDLEGLCAPHKPSRPKGGRPKGSGSKATRRVRPDVDDVTRQMIASEALDQQRSHEEVAKAYGVSVVMARLAVEKERGRREGARDSTVIADLSMSARQKLEAAIRAEKKRLAFEFEQAVQQRVQKARERMLVQIPAEWHERLTEADRIMERRKGVIPFKLFRRLLAALHPDRVDGEAAKRISTDVFDEINKLRYVLCDNKELPVKPLAGAVSRDPAVWEQGYQKRQAARRASRGNGMATTRRH